MSIADMFTAQLEDLKLRSEESDRKIAEHLKELHRLIDTMKAIELDTATDL
jgi:hypothetical protein